MIKFNKIANKDYIISAIIIAIAIVIAGWLIANAIDRSIINLGANISQALY